MVRPGVAMVKPGVAVVKPGVALKGISLKLKAFIAPTPAGQMKQPRRSEVPSPDPTRIVKPKRLGSAISTESLLVKAAVPPPEVPQTPSAGGRSIPALARRSSALPTPVNRRVSGIPCITPKSVRRGPAGERLDLLGLGIKISQGSPTQIKVFQRTNASSPKPVPQEELSCPAALEPCSLVFSLEDESEGTLISDPTPSTPQKTAQHTGHSLQHQDTPEHSTESRATPESSTGNAPESSTGNAPESSIEMLNAPESSIGNQTTPESSTGNAPESSTGNAPESSTGNTPESSTEKLNTPESSTGNAPESSTGNAPKCSTGNTPESSTEKLNAPDSSTGNQTTHESSRENQNTPKPSVGQPVHPSPEEPQKPQNYTMKTPENKEVLLVDAPVPVLRVQERLLIDLSNTSDLMRAVPLKPTGGLVRHQNLIDLSSPLITWSPVDKKENSMDGPPLINLSF
ncbi:hypothetical protein AAFF_G00061000 [Aldrovandia affinis]|uniref:Flocculation protein FLO11-like n=1 Tax=Aldrovandia affinis TaxID=143900 RepID=A0AAD7S014_9TELE|nr:hypothetical protein AAFF_G00061000 [Aldrovandia affinis]